MGHDLIIMLNWDAGAGNGHDVFCKQRTGLVVDGGSRHNYPEEGCVFFQLGKIKLL